MQIEDLVIEVRNAAFERVGRLRKSDLVGFTAVMCFNQVGSWTIALPNNAFLADELKTPGSGIIVSTDNGVILSGPTTSVVTNQTTEDPEGVFEISGVDDTILLLERLAYPEPSNSSVSTQATDYDTRTGLTEAVMKAFVNANIGPTATVDRKIANLSIETNAGLGVSVTKSARFETLQGLLVELANGSNLGFTIEQTLVGGLEFQVYQPTDKSTTIRFDLANNSLTKTEYAYTQPNVTRAIIAGSGEGVNRTFVERTSTDSLDAETVWGRRIEVFNDERGSATLTELEQAGDEILAVEGKTLVSSSVTPSDDQTMRFGYDWNLGDKVTVVIGDLESVAVVTEIGITVQEDGVYIGATVGPTTTTNFEAKVVDSVVSQEARISNLERNNSVTPASTVRQLVNNRTGSTLDVGQVVYISGAQGNRVTVALAQANAELTSSKTFGVVAETIANNQSGYVITEGSLGNLNTSAFAEGVALWLSPTTAGAYTTTKPTAPNHLVLVGFVERSQTSNGSIFVKTQNGYELDELHDVSIVSKTNGQNLVYSSTDSTWKNRFTNWPLYSGNYYTSPSTGTPAGTLLATDYMPYAVPIFIPKDCTLDTIGVQVSTLLASTAIRLGIYDASPTTGLPANRLLDAGTVVGTSVGVKTIAISQAVTAGVYWLVAKSDLAANATIYTHNTPLWPTFTTGNTFTDFVPTAYSGAVTSSGAALAASFGTATATTIKPLIFVKAA